jgi:hypothetical protein
MLISLGNSKWTNVITPLHVELLQINRIMGIGLFMRAAQQRQRLCTQRTLQNKRAE